MTAATANLVAWSLQAALVVAAAALATGAIRLGTPGVRYAWWRLVALGCLALPWLQPRTTPAAVFGDATGTGITTWLEAAPLVPATVAGAAAPSLWSMAVTVGVAGAVFRLAWLAVGARRLSQLRRTGAAAPEELHATLQQRLGTRADVRYLEAIDRPVTFGVRRPVVLLPSALATSPVEIREAVLAHELWHVRRRDWVWLLVEEVTRTALWWHPACWWLISRIQLAREELVDALTVASTGRRRAYLQALARFSDPSPLHPAPAFAWRRHLFHRMRLIAREDPMPARRLVLATLVATLVVTATGWTATAWFPLAAAGASQEIRLTAGPLERVARPVTAENPVPRRLQVVPPAPPADAAVTFGPARVMMMVTLDHAGFPVEIRFTGFAGRVHGETLNLFEQAPADANVDRVVSAAAAAGQPVDAATVRQALEGWVVSAVRAVSQWRYDAPHEAPVAFEVAVDVGGGEALDTSGDWAGNALRVGGNVPPPAKMTDVRPVYPDGARAAGIEGIVIVQARIGPQGRVELARIVRSIPELDQAALDAIYQWEFTPTIVDGQPVPVMLTMTVQFALQ